jgi:hypothetical protein
MTGPEGWPWLFWILRANLLDSHHLWWKFDRRVFFTLPETCAPILLRTKARKVLAETDDPLVYAAIDKEDGAF